MKLAVAIMVYSVLLGGEKDGDDVGGFSFCLVGLGRGMSEDLVKLV